MGNFLYGLSYKEPLISIIKNAKISIIFLGEMMSKIIVYAGKIKTDCWSILEGAICHSKKLEKNTQLVQPSNVSYNGYVAVDTQVYEIDVLDEIIKYLNDLEQRGYISNVKSESNKIPFIIKWSGLYGLIAIKTVELCKINGGLPIQGWEDAVHKTATKLSYMKKACPRGAFLGLCENGLVLNIPSGSHTKSKINKQYALEAVRILKSGSHYNDPKELWNQVLVNLGVGEITHNGQMDVVLALWKKGYIL